MLQINKLTPCPLAPLESLLLKYTIQPMINNVGVNLINSFLRIINKNGNQDYTLCTLNISGFIKYHTITKQAKSKNRVQNIGAPRESQTT